MWITPALMHRWGLAIVGVFLDARKIAVPVARYIAFSSRNIVGDLARVRAYAAMAPTVSRAGAGRYRSADGWLSSVRSLRSAYL
jgi:hypothetical protein